MKSFVGTLHMEKTCVSFFFLPAREVNSLPCNAIVCFNCFLMQWRRHIIAPENKLCAAFVSFRFEFCRVLSSIIYLFIYFLLQFFYSLRFFFFFLLFAELLLLPQSTAATTVATVASFGHVAL